ncbi:MAG: hypothetical protein IJO44_03365 [Clostridia bacterium]|nr:hypothetical protein [Clostridia bacterium]
MNIKETIMHYIDIYDGSEKRVIEKTICSHRNEFENIEKAYSAVNNYIVWLIENKYIVRVNYNEMNESQKHYFESDCCTIYKIIKRYNEAEYLKEKYGVQ